MPISKNDAKKLIEEKKVKQALQASTNRAAEIDRHVKHLLDYIENAIQTDLNSSDSDLANDRDLYIEDWRFEDHDVFRRILKEMKELGWSARYDKETVPKMGYGREEVCHYLVLK